MRKAGVELSMFWKRKHQVRWDEVGTELGKRVVSDVDRLSELFKKSIQEQNERGLPDFDGVRWRYELCQFKMFWVWYVANSPKLTKEGATKPLLDAYQKSAYIAMSQAGLVGVNKFEQLQAWERESEKRFIVYKRAYENPPPKPMFFTATLGWEFARFVFPAEEPNPKLVMLINELGSAEFRSLVETIIQ
jgi:hypothetical protein